MKRLIFLIPIILILLVGAASSQAQSGGGYDLTWSTIDSGGATFSSGGAYTMGGTIGQHDAGRLSGPPYTLAGGFWGRVAAGASPTPTPIPPACTGDCDRDGHVTIEDLLAMVNIALGNASVLECRNGDPTGNNQITVDEILRAVNRALNGC